MRGALQPEGKGSGAAAAKRGPMRTTLSVEETASLLHRLPPAGGLPPARRQPIHTVYGGAHLFSERTIAKLQEIAARSLSAYGDDLSEVFGFDPALAREIHARLAAKLAREPIEDYRVDFEDGYGVRSDEEEDAHALAVAEAMTCGGLPPSVGIRIRALSRATAGRALRTLDLFLTRIGRLPPGFLVTLPKVEDDEAPAALVAALERLEAALGLEPIAVELMVESPGGLDLRRRIEACRGRCVAVHLGAYDYLTACGVGPGDQDLGHPALDHARLTLHRETAGTGVALVDGATLRLPLPPRKEEPSAPENRQAVHGAWRIHAADVRRALRQGFHQGWDLHPAQTVSRYATVFAWYRQDLGAVAARLRNFVEHSARATRLGAGFDDAATGNALLLHLLRGLDCGALDEAEVREGTGLSREDLATRSFPEILRRREA